MGVPRSSTEHRWCQGRWYLGFWKWKHWWQWTKLRQDKSRTKLTWGLLHVWLLVAVWMKLESEKRGVYSRTHNSPDATSNTKKEGVLKLCNLIDNDATSTEEQLKDRFSSCTQLFPECVAKGSRLILEVWRLESCSPGVARATAAFSQPFATAGASRSLSLPNWAALTKCDQNSVIAWHFLTCVEVGRACRVAGASNTVEACQSLCVIFW